jgi:uncharacterized protein (TIGR02996 family)
MIELELIDPRHGPRMVRLVLDGRSLYRIFGPPAGPWRTSVREFDDYPQTKLALERALDKLIVAGYELGAHNHELIGNIAAAPDQLHNYLVYGDWLLDHNDPRGELIHLMVALEQRPDDSSLQADLARLREQHRLRFERRGWQRQELHWRWGFVEGLRVPAVPQLNVQSPWPRQWLLALRSHPSGRFVRRLRVDSRTYEVDFGDPVTRGLSLREVDRSKD